ncbi:MAG: GNAT family N-acetyltransferase [Eubacteriales bacterium]
MIKLETDRLILRKWTEADAESLFEYAKDPDVGPIAGWQSHRSVEESLDVIRNVLNGEECYAICEKGSNRAIGAIELMLKGHTNRLKRDDECELGYWLGKPFWGRGYMPEAAREIIRRGFEDIGMNTIWCGYYEGNQKSKRVQEKVGFAYHHTCENVPVPLLGEVRTEHINILTREHWKEITETPEIVSTMTITGIL